MTCPLHARPDPCQRCTEVAARLRDVIAAVHAGTTADEIRRRKP